MRTHPPSPPFPLATTNSSARTAVPATPSARAAPTRRARGMTVRAQAVATKTVKIGTRGSPLAMAQAYLTRDLLKVREENREGFFGG
jgi:hydroxymethylbilane synthase